MATLWQQITSEENLGAAWRQVRRASGCPGVDGQSLEAFELQLPRHLGHLRADLLDGTYRPLPLQRFYVAKRHGGLRPLGVPTVRDRVAQAAVARCLQPLTEARFLPCSYAYRPGRSWLHAVNDLCRLRDRGCGFVLEADIDAFFDTLDHERLLRLVRGYTRERAVVGLVAQWLAAPVCDDGNLLPSYRGVPQGAVIAPLLSNVYLHPFDVAVCAAGLRLIRYADDFVIACVHEAQAYAAQALVGEELRQCRLRLEPAKTRITSFEQGFEFLGTQFRRRERVLPAGGFSYWRAAAAGGVPPPLPPARLRPLWQDELLALSLVEAYAYCPRGAALRLLTAERPLTPEMVAGRAAERRHHRGLRVDPAATLVVERPVVAPRLGLQGLVDAVQEKWGALAVIEYRFSWSEEVQEAVAVKLAAAALALEEMEGQAVALAYVEFLPGGRRVPVELTAERAAAARAAVAGLRALLESGELPPPAPSERCQGCSLRPACLPEETRELAELLSAMVGAGPHQEDAPGEKDTPAPL